MPLRCRVEYVHGIVGRVGDVNRAGCRVHSRMIKAARCAVCGQDHKPCVLQDGFLKDGLLRDGLS